MQRLVLDAAILGGLGEGMSGLGKIARVRKTMAIAQYIARHLDSVSSQLKTSLVVEGSEEALAKVAEVLDQVKIAYTEE